MGIPSWIINLTLLSILSDTPENVLYALPASIIFFTLFFKVVALSTNSTVPSDNSTVPSDRVAVPSNSLLVPSTRDVLEFFNVVAPVSRVLAPVFT